MLPTENAPTTNHVVLLDVSLFILEVLDPQRILDRFQNDNIVLEVPSAFATMIRDAQAGNALLQQFIYANILSLRRNPIHQQSDNIDIRRLILATEEELIVIRNDIVRLIIRDYAPLIRGASRPANQNEYITEPSLVPIQRYEPLAQVSSDELHNLRMAYMHEIPISPHPLIDLYFLQVFHAQTEGSDNQLNRRRELVSIGRTTYETIRNWRGGQVRRYESSTNFLGQRGDNNQDARVVQQGRNLLTQVVNNYFRPRWIPIITATTNILIDVVISIPQSGGIGWGAVGLAVIGYYSAELVVTGIINPTNQPYEVRLAYILAGVLLIAVVFIIFLAPKVSARLLSNISSTPTVILDFGGFYQTTPQPMPTNIIAADILVAPIAPIFTETATLIPSVNSFEINYCLYVVQPGDTLQSIASRFQVTEEDLRTNNTLTSSNILAIHQRIKINASCCRPSGVNGFTYTVQHGETLYRLAKRYGSTVENLAAINNLLNPRYIQTGQMLCIP